MIRDLLEIAIRMVSQELSGAQRAKAEEQAEDRLIDMLLPLEESGLGRRRS